VKVHTLEPALVSAIDLSSFSTVLIGRGALGAADLAGAIPALETFAKRGGTVVVLPGGDEIARSGLFPYPITFDSNPPSIRDPATPVRASDTRSTLFHWPNVIRAADFAGWTGERAAGLPDEFDRRYESPLIIGGAKDTPARGAILAARLGRGVVIYTSLSLDEQLAAVHPGAARLMINLLAAGLAPSSAK
jgi:hypothetical protein